MNVANQLNIIGRLTREPELRTTASGKNVCSFSVAVSKTRRDDGAEYFDCTAWDKTAEFVTAYCTKGTQVAVHGEISKNEYTKKNGEKGFSLAVNVDGVSLLGSKSENANKAPSEPNTNASSIPSGFVEVVDDELPF